MAYDIVVPTCKDYTATWKQVEAMAEHDKEKHNYIITAFPVSASVNRNYGLYEARKSDNEYIIMIDDDIEGFYPGWQDDLVAPLKEFSSVRMTSARLLDRSGKPACMMGIDTKDLLSPLVEAPKFLSFGSYRFSAILSAAIAFRKKDIEGINFDMNFIGSGWEDTHFCFLMHRKHDQCRFVCVNGCRLVHRNEMKAQGPNYRENEELFKQLVALEMAPKNIVPVETKPKYHSEHGQDRWLNENIFKGKTGGVFFECGALDGVRDSNSLFFENELGWTGLCVEANPVEYASLAQNRKCATEHCALYDTAGVEKFVMIEGGLVGWSGIDEAIEPQHRERIEKNIDTANRQTIDIRTMPLADVLRKHGLTKIDYLSLDIEGAELKVLSVFPFEEFDIDVFDIENNFDNPEIEQIMTEFGYRKIARLGVNDIYRRQA